MGRQLGSQSLLLCPCPQVTATRVSILGLQIHCSESLKIQTLEVLRTSPKHVVLRQDGSRGLSVPTPSARALTDVHPAARHTEAGTQVLSGVWTEKCGKLKACHEGDKATVARCQDTE